MNIYYPLATRTPDGIGAGLNWKPDAVIVDKSNAEVTLGPPMSGQEKWQFTLI